MLYYNVYEGGQNMGIHFDQIPDEIKSHIREVTKTSGLPDSEESLERIAGTWLEKRKLFQQQLGLLHMHEVESVESEALKAVLMLTYSGSLVAIGVPAKDISSDTYRRWAEYASIGLRMDVPDIARKTDAAVSGSIVIGEGVEFIDGPIKKSSPLLIIATCGDDVSLAEQDNRVREATIFLTNGFVKINRTLSSAGEAIPDQFTMRSMVAYLAAKNGMTQKNTKQMLDDYLTLIETGVLLGEKVPIGRLGKMQLRLRPPQKARVGRNPGTGEEITVGAKPAMYVPALSFSSSLKEKARSVSVDN
jgi:nucleoid DNA-binding protein